MGGRACTITTTLGSLSPSEAVDASTNILYGSSGLARAGSIVNLPYTPRVRVRALLLLLLRDSYPEPVSLQAIRSYLGIEAGTREDRYLKRTLQHLVEVGVAVRVGRGLYKMTQEYYEKTMSLPGFYEGIKQIVEPSLIISKLSKLKKELFFSESTSRREQVTTGTFLTSKKVSEKIEKSSDNKESNQSIEEKVIEYARSKFGEEIDEIDEVVLRVFSRIKEETGSWYLEYMGYSFDVEVQEWARRLGLCSSSNSSRRDGCPGTEEISESLRKLVRLRLLFYDRRRKKLRLNRRVLEEVG